MWPAPRARALGLDLVMNAHWGLLLSPAQTPGLALVLLPELVPPWPQPRPWARALGLDLALVPPWPQPRPWARALGLDLALYSDPLSRARTPLLLLPELVPPWPQRERVLGLDLLALVPSRIPELVRARVWTLALHPDMAVVPVTPSLNVLMPTLALVMPALALVLVRRTSTMATRITCYSRDSYSLRQRHYGMISSLLRQRRTAPT